MWLDAPGWIAVSLQQLKDEMQLSDKSLEGAKCRETRDQISKGTKDSGIREALNGAGFRVAIIELFFLYMGKALQPKKCELFSPIVHIEGAASMQTPIRSQPQP